ncbi:hypothetical protein PUN49_20550 [Pseudomonas extremaustralis]|jgi:hypothetical protein|uniref:hypothetical protein n=1 Tax=unclassified Pseudomonas TaxID=196821 RepID=UPI00070547BE|nr:MULTISPECIES: hypothetical protein [unclassified Pseudomonas]KRP68116.1 hypothetical protein TU80_28150 [Pseudomonas veronii]MDG2969416.1 hypothetical protein [Pseudomonas extremaustralis]PMU96254.1 hypothetical protein C1Y28_07725 [Pseudomonas sp. GW704-F5]PMV06330.1 hypothetical protein C1Y29_07135 [Pseudomonas sp. MPBD4-3]PMV32979.1 hypothetical protein C1Y27_12390 [Pseudomonas sp. GW704-F2]
MAVLLSKGSVQPNHGNFFIHFLKSAPVKTQTTLIRSMLLICFLGLMAACDGGEKLHTAESAEHGHSHE